MKRLSILVLLALALSGCGQTYEEQMGRIATEQAKVDVPHGWVRFCDYKTCWLVADPDVWNCPPPSDKRP